MSDIIYSSARAIAEAIREKEVSAVEVAQAHLDRIGEVNERLNAVVLLCDERALDEAREADAMLARGESKGPLHGVPMTLKDSLDTEGVVTTGGTTGRKDFVPDQIRRSRRGSERRARFCWARRTRRSLRWRERRTIWSMAAQTIRSTWSGFRAAQAEARRRLSALAALLST